MYFEYSRKTSLPVDFVYKTLRDDLPKLAPYMPNVSSIEVLERKETPDKISMTNRWLAKNLLPPVVDQFIKTNEMAWLDRAEWPAGRYACSWRYEPFIFNEYINASGENTYTSDGTQTTITYSGDVRINFASYPLLPHKLRDKVNEEIEKIIQKLIQSNLDALVDGLEKYARENNHAGSSHEKDPSTPGS